MSERYRAATSMNATVNTEVYRKPKGPGLTKYALPDPNTISAHCRTNEHGQCSRLSCGCFCHKRLI